MNKRNGKVSAAARIEIFATSSLLALMAAGAAAAQTAAPAQTPVASGTVVQEIVVTGTQIRGVAPVGAPVITVGQQEIVDSGLNTTADILHDIPQITTLGAGQAYAGGNQNANLNTNRDNAINIRGLGPQATLTLLDGRRTPLGGSTGNLFDPSSIPTIAIGNIDVVADGASAIYGSDAVAGVANIVLRKNFDGFEAEAAYGTAAGGYDTTKFGGIFGHKWDGGSIMLAVETDFASRLVGSQRQSFNQCNVAGVNSCSPYYPSYGNVTFSNTPAGHYLGVPLTGNGTGITAAELTGENYFNSANDADLLPKTNRNSAVWSIQQDATSNIALWTEGYFTQNNTSFPLGQLSPSGTVTTANPGFIPYPAGATSEKGYTSLDSVLGPEVRFGYERAYQAAAGADVTLPANWAFNIYGEHNYNYEYTNTQGLNAAADATAFACTTPGICFDPFGPAPGNAAAIASIVGNAYYHYTQQEDLVNAKIDGPLYTLPGGDVKLAVGTEIHHDTLSVLSVNTTASPAVDILHTAANFGLGRTVASAFGEVIIPVIGANNQLPFVQSFVIDGAGRYDHYSDVGGTANPKVSFRWKPFSDVSIHGDYGTSFRAPTLCDTDAGCTGSTLSSPPTAFPGHNVIEVVGGNSAVKPETATTWSFGVDYRPSWLSGFSATADYFNIDYSNVIGTPGQNVSGDSELPGGSNSKTYASFIIDKTQSPAAFASELAYLEAQPFFSPPTAFTPSQITDIIIGTRQNAGVILTSGIDFTADYKWANAYGAWSAGVSGTYLIDYRESLLAGLPIINELNKWEYPVSWRGRARFSWSADNLTAVAYVNYTGAYENNADVNGQPNTTVNAYTTVDATLLYRITQEKWLAGYAKNTTLSIAVQNLFDAGPPYALTSTTTEYDAEQASPLGRVVTVNIRKAF